MVYEIDFYQFLEFFTMLIMRWAHSERLTIKRESLSRRNGDTTYKDEAKGRREKEGKENEEEEKEDE